MQTKLVSWRHSEAIESLHLLNSQLNQIFADVVLTTGLGTMTKETIM